jgi:hypothetical protein
MNKTSTLLSLDLEWVVYDLHKKCIDESYMLICTRAKDNNHKTCISTWASWDEIYEIDKKTWLLWYIWVNDIFSCEAMWYTKSNPLFFQSVLDATRCTTGIHVDDGINGILWAKSAWFMTYFLWKKSTLIPSDYYIDTLQNFYFILNTLNE